MTSEARRDALLAYVLTCRDQMRLGAWDIDIDTSPPQDESYSLQIDHRPLLWWAQIQIGTFFNMDPEKVRNSPEDQRITVIHELIHLVQSPAIQFIKQGDWRVRLSMDQTSIIEDTLMDQLEKQAEFLARALAPLFPMPPIWPPDDADAD